MFHEEKNLTQQRKQLWFKPTAAERLVMVSNPLDDLSISARKQKGCQTNVKLRQNCLLCMENENPLASEKDRGSLNWSLLRVFLVYDFLMIFRSAQITSENIIFAAKSYKQNNALYNPLEVHLKKKAFKFSWFCDQYSLDVRKVDGRLLPRFFDWSLSIAAAKELNTRTQDVTHSWLERNWCGLVSSSWPIRGLPAAPIFYCLRSLSRLGSKVYIVL